MGRLSYANALNKIQFEHTLIHYRMTWLFTSQGFFLAAYFALKSDTFKEFQSKAEYSLFLSIAAALTAIMFYASILAAHLAMRIWRKRAKDNERDALISEFIIHYLGDAPASTISLIFVAFWVNASLADQHMPHVGQSHVLWLVLATFSVAAFIWFLVTKWKFSIDPKKPNKGDVIPS